MQIASKISTWFLWWILYSVFGWVFETLVCSIEMGQWADRGFLYGPLCPIYGTSALLSLVIFKRIKHAALLFLAGAAMVVVIEYSTSLVLEQLFGQIWWDYSAFRFNIHGRVSLLGAVVFGVMIVLLIKLIHPRVEALTTRIQDKTKLIAAGILALILAFDFSITLFHLLTR